VLTLGWHGEFTPMLQPYSGHGSPYWGSNGFLGLLLSPTHPVWSDVEEPAPIDRDDYCVALPGPGFVASGTCADGIVRATSHVSDHFPLPSYYQRTRLPARLRRAAAVLRPDRGGRDSSAPYDAHYRKLAYSTHTAPDLGDVADALDVDSQVALIQSESLVSRRARFHPVGVVDRFAASVFYPDEPRAHRRVETVAISHGECEIRIHHASTDRQERLRDGGFAIASDEPPDVVANDRWCLVRRSDGLTSCIAGLHALEDHGVQHLDGANAFGSHSAAPYVVSLDPIGAEGVFVSLNVLSGAPFDPDAIIDSVAVAVHGRMAVVSCGDSETYLVQLVAPEKIDLALGSKHLQGRIRLARVSLDGTNFTLSA